MTPERSLLSLLVSISAIVLSCHGTKIETGNGQDALHHLNANNLFNMQGMDNENNIVMMFGLELFSEVHNRMEKCREEKRKVEMRFANKSSHLHQYYYDTKAVMEQQEFADLVKENIAALQSNFKKTFKALKKSRERQLEKVESNCSKALDSIMEKKLHEALSYAESILISNPPEFASLTVDASVLVTQLRGLLRQCKIIRDHRPTPSLVRPAEEEIDPDVHGNMDFDLCYVHEIEALINFIDHFLAQADELSEKYYRDDEDYYDNKFGASGDFEADLDGDGKEKVVKTQKASSPPVKEEEEEEMIPISNFFEPGPVILGHNDGKEDKSKPTDTDPPSKKPSDIGDNFMPGPVILDPSDGKSEPAPPSPTTKSPLDGHDISDFLEPGPVIPQDPTDKKSEDGKEEVPPTTTETPLDDGDIGGLFEPGPEIPDPDKDDKDAAVTTSEIKSTHKPPDWLDDAFDEVVHVGHKKDEEEENTDISEKGLKTSASKFKGEDEVDSELQGSLDVDLPGVNIEIDSDGIDIETNEGDSQQLSIVFDDDQAVDPTDGSSEDDDDNFITYMLIYFFTTLGSLLLLTIIVLSIAIIALRMRNRTPKDTPLLSEDDTIAVMKQTGYVNPTYKFFDRVKEV